MAELAREGRSTGSYRRQVGVTKSKAEDAPNSHREPRKVTFAHQQDALGGRKHGRVVREIGLMVRVEDRTNVAVEVDATRALEPDQARDARGRGRRDGHLFVDVRAHRPARRPERYVSLTWLEGRAPPRCAQAENQRAARAILVVFSTTS